MANPGRPRSAASVVSRGLVRLQPLHYRLSLRLRRGSSDDPIDLWVVCNRFENFPTLTLQGGWLDIEFRLRHDGIQLVTDAFAGRAVNSYNAILEQVADQDPNCARLCSFIGAPTAVRETTEKAKNFNSD